MLNLRCVTTFALVLLSGCAAPTPFPTDAVSGKSLVLVKIKGIPTLNRGQSKCVELVSLDQGVSHVLLVGENDWIGHNLRPGRYLLKHWFYKSTGFKTDPLPLGFEFRIAEPEQVVFLGEIDILTKHVGKGQVDEAKFVTRKMDSASKGPVVRGHLERH